MAQWVTVWRAAQLAGVPRSALQQRVRAGEIELNDGLISTETLRRLYPLAEIESSGLFENVARIKDEAFGRRVRERLLPSQEVLAQRLFSQTQALADAERHLQRYHALVVALRDTLRAQLAGGGDARLEAVLRQLNDGLARALATEPVDVRDVMDDMIKVVSAEVTLQPSGHRFTVEGRDSLLQAGLRAGLELNYGCGNGSCGLCKVRVTAGQVQRVAPSDYPLSAAEKAQGYVLACAHTAASAEVTLETLEAGGPDDIPEQQITASVRALRPLGADTLALHLQTPRSHRLRFLAGQSATLGSTAGGGDARTTYPIASCPCDDRNLHFVVPRRGDDPLAARLFAGAVKPGDAVTVWGPTGRFVLEDGARPLVFAACDAGFAPIKSLIEHALSLDLAPSIALFWLATRRDGHFMANQCRAWSEALDAFEYTPSTDTDAASGASRMAQAIRADLFDIDCTYYIAGPAEFVERLGAELAAAGVAAGRLHREVLA